MQLRREPVGMVLRVVIDRPDPGISTTGAAAASHVAPAGGPAEDSIGVADCQRVSQDLSALLDVEDDELGEAALAKAYTLEVSSPGLDRPLRHEADYRRFAGRLAKIVTIAAVDGQSAFAGRLAGVATG
ncbi:MAG: hypothetical protein M3545_14490, partial [Acidobacteriota bacterium]|nr:hypothetical protein [Acidobacteriota bacterium]